MMVMSTSVDATTQSVMNISTRAIVTSKEIEGIKEECVACESLFKQLNCSRIINKLLFFLNKMRHEVRLIEIQEMYNSVLKDTILSSSSSIAIQKLTKEEQIALANFNACLLLRRAAVHHALEDYDNELRDVNAVMELNKLFTIKTKYICGAWEKTALVAADLNQHENAVAAWSKYLEYDPMYHDAYYNRALSWSSLRNHENAIKDNVQCISLNVENIEAYINCAACYLDLGQHETSLQFLELAMEQDPKHPMAFMGKFKIFYKLKEYKQALRCLRKVEKLISNPDSEYNDRMKDLWDEYGNVYYSMATRRRCICSKCAKTEEDKQKRKMLFRKYCDKSIAAYIKSRHYARMRKIPMDGDGSAENLIDMLRERAKLHQESEQLNESLADCALIIKVNETMNRDLHEVYNMIGQLYIVKGMPDASLLAFRNALRQHSMCDTALRGRALSLHKLGNLEEAYDDFRELDKKHPDSTHIKYWISVLERNRKEMCAKCDKTATNSNPLKRCVRCKMVRYCSLDCQRSDWIENHREHCDISNRLDFHKKDPQQSQIHQQEVVEGGVVSETQEEGESKQHNHCKYYTCNRKEKMVEK